MSDLSGKRALVTGAGMGIGQGIAVELDEVVIEAHPKQDVHFNLFAEGWERRGQREAQR